MVLMLEDPRLFTGGQFVIRPRAWDSRLQSRQAHQEISLMPPLVVEPALHGGVGLSLFFFLPPLNHDLLVKRHKHLPLSLFSPLPITHTHRLRAQIIFDSIADHAVTPIESGKRTVLAVELWPFAHVDITGMR